MAALDKSILLQLQFTPLFARLSEADVIGLTDGADVQVFLQDHVLYRQGDEMTHFYVVLDGHVELSVDRSGRRSVVEVARRGAVLGDDGLFAGRVFQMSARILNGATVLAVPVDGFLQKLESRFDIITHMLTTMSFRLRAQVRQISELKLKTTAQRLGNFLLFLAAGRDGRVEVRFPYDKKLVADELGMKPESLSRALAKLSRAGVTSLADNGVLIGCVDRLRDFCIEDDAG